MSRLATLAVCLYLSGSLLWAAEPRTFSRDIAPIVYRHCAPCHRPGQAAPFSLLTFSDVKKRAKQIVEVTSKRYMPPWLPEAGYGDFKGQRRLSDTELGMLREWGEQGAPEGDPADLPVAPQFTSDWRLGPPDLIVEMPEAYELQPGGKDVYRNFVIPLSVTNREFVSAFEFRPETKAIHHAFIKIDPSGECRRLDAQDTDLGFPGMEAPNAQMPGGHFLTWQPGKTPAQAPDGLAWTLEPDTDLVLQLHMNPTGKPEKIRPLVGLYFTTRAPTNTLFKMQLASMTLDIPAGTSNYIARDSFVLPTDVFAVGVLPHAHYLAKEMRGFATLPNGTREWLLWIRDWDFAWQGDYQYAEPVFLPKGSRLEMEYVYDNSTNNVRNPNHPPRRVQYGAGSNDEMAELWLQLLVPNTNETARVSAAYDAKMRQLFLEHYQLAVRLDPNDGAAHLGLGKTLLSTGKLSEGLNHVRTAARLKPNDADGHYTLGLIYLQMGRGPYAKLEFERTLQLEATYFKAVTYLGILAFQAGKLEEAEAKFRESLRINAGDRVARENLNLVLKARKS